MKKGSALAMLMCKAIHQQMLKYMGKFSGLQGLTKLSVAIPAPVSGQSAVNVATATSSVR